MNNKLFALMGEKKIKYSLKKTQFGVVSVAVASLLAFGNVQMVSAAEEGGAEAETETVLTTAEESQAESQSNEEVTEEVQETNEEIEEIKEEVEEKEETKKVGNDPNLVIKELDEDKTFGEQSYKHVEHLTEKIGNRTVGTVGEASARNYIAGFMEGLGYSVDTQNFEFTRQNKKYESSNIVAVKKGKSEKELIIGAHYDSVTVEGNTGADDNASGVALLLEMAQRIFNEEIPYTVRFIFFGAEEMGLQGSKYYAENMTEKEVENTIGMVNIDSILAGDYNYMYSGEGGEGWLRDQAFDIASALGMDHVKTNTGEYSEIPYGETGDWSDHAPFKKLGIPVVYLESSNWSLGMDEKGNPIEMEPGNVGEEGYVQTLEHGRIYHTGNDNLGFLLKEFPGRVQGSLNTFAAILYNLIMNVTLPGETTGDEEAPSDNEVVDPSENEKSKEQEQTVEDPKGQSGNIVHAAEESKTLPATGEAATLATSLAMLAGGLGLSFAFKKRD